MGYSCAAAAARVMDAVSAACIRQTGSSNVYKVGGETYFFEQGRENGDGAITGKIMRMLPGDLCRKAGTYRIEPDGTFGRVPAFFKQAVQDAVDANRSPYAFTVY